MKGTFTTLPFTRTRNSCVHHARTSILGQSKLRESLKRNSNAPIVSGGSTVERSLDANEIKLLTFNTKTTTNEGLTRKHNIAMDGQVGHGRRLSNDVNFMIHNYEGKGNYPSIGFGSDIAKLK